jgi:hypothetical protein
MPRLSKIESVCVQQTEPRMIDPAKQTSQFNRREALRTVGATVALAAASGAVNLTGGAHAATPSVNASDRAEPGFWPNGARLAVSLPLCSRAAGSRSPAPAASSRIRSRRASRTCRRTHSSPMVITSASHDCVARTVDWHWEEP